ncbi:radical SAM/SPASM domain-containing protein [Clostridium rectalis]|uniref:radical SAM/SPASM domain-containing protein n=1 Tax=Clostridium rectalis TaxID=2040295 RepID=UPI000F63435F|nr:radical SAM protein [Clostridium rectalis]
MRDFFSAPGLVDISITNRCNLKCDYCYASSGPEAISNQELTLDDFKRLFDELEKLNVHRISLSGGEPFIRKDFFEILEATQKYRFAKIINTNATLIDNDIAKKLSNYKFDRICVSLDGSNKQTHEKIRGKNTFEKTINGIKNLQQYKLPVSTLFTLNKNNVDNLIECIKFNEQLGITYMKVMVVCPTGRASDGDILVTKEQWYPVFLQLSKMMFNKEIKLHFKIVPPNESEVFWLYYFPLEYYNRLDLLPVWGQNNIINNSSKRDISCQSGINACSIIQNGDVYGCDLMIGIDEFKAGNIKENSFGEIWIKSEVFKKLRNINFDDLQGKCKKCNKSWCGAGCRSAAYNLYGSIYGSDESCYYESEEE